MKSLVYYNEGWPKIVPVHLLSVHEKGDGEGVGVLAPTLGESDLESVSARSIRETGIFIISEILLPYHGTYSMIIKTLLCSWFHENGSLRVHFLINTN